MSCVYVYIFFPSSLYYTPLVSLISFERYGNGENSMRHFIHQMMFDGRVECSNHNTVWHARAQQFFVSQKNITALCLKCGTVPFEWKTANAGSKFWNTAVEEFLANITYNPCCECDKTPTEEMFRGQILKDKTSPEKSRQRITKNKVYCDMRVKSAVIELQEMFHIHGWD